MPAIQRFGDPNDAGAAIEGGCAGTVFAGNKKVAINGSAVANHKKSQNYDHEEIKTANGSSNVFAEFTPVNFDGNADSCVTHNRISGLNSVQVNS